MIRQTNKIVFPRFPKKAIAEITDISGLEDALDAKLNTADFQPENLPQNPSHRFVRDSQIKAWNENQPYQTYLHNNFI